MNHSAPVIEVVTGCTATGKTAWALQWAETHGAEIISCDSLLFYRGMDIGTAKPSAAERARIPHHLIDVCDVTGSMDVATYVRLALRAVDDIHARGRRILVVGGSGFYLRAFFAPVIDGIQVPASIRQEVAALSLAEAVAELHRRNPAGLGRLDLANPRRVQRALERCRAAGRPLAELAAEFARQPGPFSSWQVNLRRIDCPPDELDRRIAARAAGMVAAGLLDEVRSLLDRGLRQNRSAARAIGYRESIAVLEGTLPKGDLVAEIARNTRALVKKQRTWFRTQLPPPTFISPTPMTQLLG